MMLVHAVRHNLQNMCNIMYPNRVRPNHGGCRDSYSERRRGLEATIELKALKALQSCRHCRH